MFCFRSLALEILLLICSKANAENGADILAQFLPGILLVFFFEKLNFLGIVSQLTDLVAKITIGKLDTLGKAVEAIFLDFYLTIFTQHVDYGHMEVSRTHF